MTGLLTFMLPIDLDTVLLCLPCSRHLDSLLFTLHAQENTRFYFDTERRRGKKKTILRSILSLTKLLHAERHTYGFQSW